VIGSIQGTFDAINEAIKQQAEARQQAQADENGHNQAAGTTTSVRCPRLALRVQDGGSPDVSPAPARTQILNTRLLVGISSRHDGQLCRQ
jgi:hypothetical protein